MNRILCWWFGCVPDYDAVYYDTHQDAWSNVVPCKRCGAPDTDYACRVGDTRHRWTMDWLRHWLFRRWLPVRCDDCGKRRGDHDGCIPF